MSADALPQRCGLLEERLLRAFDPEPPPAVEDVVEHQCEQCDILCADFGGKRWDKVPDALIEKHRADLPLLAPKAFAYFIPAFIRYTLRNFTCSSLAFYYLLENVAPSDDPLPDWSRERLRYLTREQMDVIGAFVQLVVEQDELRLAFGDLGSRRQRFETMWAERWES